MKDLTPEISSFGGGGKRGLFADFSANNFQSEAIIIWHGEGVMQQILKTAKNVNEQDPRQFLWDVLGMVGVKNDVISIGVRLGVVVAAAAALFLSLSCSLQKEDQERMITQDKMMCRG